MARKPKPTTFALEVIDKEALQYVKDCYQKYGTTTLEDRALPDYRDGLLKVYRRTIWSMSHIAPASKPHVKTARVSGDVIGKYHPHGSAAVESAIETMVNSPNPTADGVGNWGGQNDVAAAARYTNVRLSTYADTVFLNPDYMSSVDYIPNYDNKDVEPVLLPALLPNVLLNPTQGIAVGLATTTPAFEISGVIKLLQGMLKGKKLTTSSIRKTLQPIFSYGGYCDLTEEWQTGATSLIETGKGSLYVYCEFDFDTKGELNITAIPPRMSQDTLMVKLMNTGYFSHVVDKLGKNTETHAHISCTIKRGVSQKEVEEWCDDNLVATVPYQIAVVERYFEEESQTIRANVYQWGIKQILEKWLEWRIELESRMLANKEQDLLKKIERKNLLLIAQENRAIVAKSWEADDAVKYLVSKIDGITEQDAKDILSLRIMQLTKLDRQKLLEEIKGLKQEVKTVKSLQAKPDVSVLNGLDSIKGLTVQD